jgi:hypothetical protein
MLTATQAIRLRFKPAKSSPWSDVTATTAPCWENIWTCGSPRRLARRASLVRHWVKT